MVDGEKLTILKQQLQQALSTVQSSIENQQQQQPKDQRCGHCRKLLCKSSGYVEIKCNKCGHLNVFE